MVLTPEGLSSLKKPRYQRAAKDVSHLQLPDPHKKTFKKELREDSSVSSGSNSSASSTTQIVKDTQYEGGIVEVLIAHRKKRICRLVMLLLFLTVVMASFTILALHLAKIL